MSYLERLRNRQSGMIGTKKNLQSYRTELTELTKPPFVSFDSASRKGTQLFSKLPSPTESTATASSEPVAPATVATEPLPNQTEPAAANRQSMPHIASGVDAFHKVFGADQVKVTFAEENGARLGRLEVEPKADTWYYYRYWCGTRSDKGFCVIGFAPPVAHQAGDTCEHFTREALP